MGLIENIGKFFDGKTVLVTGHTGFIGSWLSIWLNELGSNVIGYALPPYTKKDNFVVSNLEDKIEHIIGDVRNFENVKRVFEKYNPEIIFHLAAQSIVRKSFLIPKDTYDINIGGTVNLIENFRINKDSRILINVTTDKCYENRECLEGYKEDDRLGGYDPYSSSKACSELVTSAYRNSFFKNSNSKNQKALSSVRSGNVIGGGDWQVDRLIPDIISAIQKNEGILIRNPNFIRPWQYILEPIRGYLILAMKMADGDTKFTGAWNFGPSTENVYKVEEIVKKIINKLDRGNYSPPSNNNLREFHESKVLLLDIKKSRDLLGWNPVLSIDETIEFLLDWYFSDDINYEFDVNQIENYLKKLK